MKKLIGILHLWLGLISGIVIFTVAITGCIYCFEEELRGFVHSDLLVVKKTTGSPVSLEEQVSTVKARFPGQPVRSIKIRTETDRSTEIILKNKLSVFVDPYTGKILGSFNKDTDIFGVALKIHRSLYLDNVGKIITGISALVFTIMLISGIILWWPRKSRFRKEKFSIKTNASSRKLNYDLHSVLGFYAAWIIIFTALTGLIWSFKWAENTMYWLTGSAKEERKTFHSAPNNGKAVFAIDAIVAKAETLYPGSAERSILLPEDAKGVCKVFLRYPDAGFFRKTDQLFFDQYSAEIIKAQTYAASSTGDKLKSTNYDIHTGKVLGLTGQFIVFFAGLIAASLPVTGFMVWRSKRRKVTNHPLENKLTTSSQERSAVLQDQ